MYTTRAAQEAKQTSYGNESYWDYLEQHTLAVVEKLRAKGDEVGATAVMNRTLAEALQGNEGL